MLFFITERMNFSLNGLKTKMKNVLFMKKSKRERKITP